MKFYFPDSQDQVDPHFDMISEEHPVHRIRQRDDRYAHEVLEQLPFDGLLVSKPIVDGHGSGAAGHYSSASRSRLYREGVQRFFRLDQFDRHLHSLGDCGAFTYVAEEEPPYTVDEVIDFYAGCGFDAGIAPDHIVFGFVRASAVAPSESVDEWERRRTLTIENARAFLDRHQARRCSFEPIAAAHGWSAETYAQSVAELQQFGYRRIALGGMVPLRTEDIVSSLEAISKELLPDVQLHLLGVTRTKDIPTFASFGVTSFDSTSPFRQSFKDARDNYYTFDSTYVAIRVPQVDGNAALKRRIAAGQLDQRLAIESERATLSLLRSFDKGVTDLEDALSAAIHYEQLTLGRNGDSESYKRTLEDSPWKHCTCGLCEQIGIDIMLFRGSERNKRRGFHNLAVFRNRLNNTLQRSVSKESHNECD